MIDSHHHFWDPDRRDYPWMTGEAAALRRPFGPDDLRPFLVRAGVAATVLVQTVADIEETREFLRLAAATDFVAGVVGWVDLTAADVSESIAALRRGIGGEFLVGIRHQVHDEVDPVWLRREDVGRGLAAVAEAELVYDLLVRPRELPAAIEVTRHYPHLRFVVDHLAKPPIASGGLEPWATLIRGFAGQEHVACKLSGMVTEVGREWTVDRFVPYVATVLEVFGEERVMFGSDWPVCTLAASYERVVDTLREALAAVGPYPPATLGGIFGANAAHWYRLPV